MNMQATHDVRVSKTTDVARCAGSVLSFIEANADFKVTAVGKDAVYILTLVLSFAGKILRQKGKQVLWDFTREAIAGPNSVGKILVARPTF